MGRCTMLFSHGRLALLGVVVAVMLGACATPPSADDPAALASFEEINDPLEPLNRGIFSFNQFADGILFKPMALVYRTFVPPPVRESVSNFLDNLRSPVILANDLLQGEGERAWVTTERFFINSIVGIGGLFDPATSMGIEGHDEDFGQTLAVWGSGEGMYLMLPLFGPSNVRDGIGLVGDIVLDPMTYYASSDLRLARLLVDGVVKRERVIDTLDEIERTSIDFYATLRSLYRQHRAGLIRNGAPAPAMQYPDLSFDDFSNEPFDEISSVD